MNPLTSKRCFNHESREAAARCKECQDYFCRECITEHQFKIYCAKCHTVLFAKKESKARHFIAPMISLFSFIVAVMILWMSFYVIGVILKQIPAEFHSTGIVRN
ncbi:rhomboid family protein [bacterium AH-315-E10]|nr:rhomboid family protein [bacterium AH-315-E10]